MHRNFFPNLETELLPHSVQVLDGKELKSVLPTVKRVVLIEGENRRGRPEVMTWAQLQEMGRATPDSELDRIEEEQFVNEACVLVYTSGTTGKPKGVMVSQVRRVDS